MFLSYNNIFASMELNIIIFYDNKGKRKSEGKVA